MKKTVNSFLLTATTNYCAPLCHWSKQSSRSSALRDCFCPHFVNKLITASLSSDLILGKWKNSPGARWGEQRGWWSSVMGFSARNRSTESTKCAGTLCWWRVKSFSHSCDLFLLSFFFFFYNRLNVTPILHRKLTEVEVFCNHVWLDLIPLGVLSSFSKSGSSIIA